MFNPRNKPPNHLFIEITTECNLRCKQCHLWMSREDKDKSLKTEEKLDIIRQFYSFNRNGCVVLSGGETMLKTDEFFAITSLCRKLNLKNAANTNATYITNDELVEKTLTLGPSYLVISLDSHIPDIHDYMRGVQGCHSHVINVIKSLVKLKKERYPEIDTQILTNSVIFDGNIHLLKDYINFAKEIGIDGVMFQMLSPTFNFQGEDDVFFEKHFFKDTTKAKEYIDLIIESFRNDGFVIINENDLQWMKLYIDNPYFIGEQVCNSHERNMIIDSYGDVQLCFNMKSLTNGKPLGNAREDSLYNLWTSQSAEDARKIMSICRKNCGMLHCHRKQTTLNPSSKRSIDSLHIIRLFARYFTKKGNRT